jgi:uncharacterized protein YggU (UPF0235/DUF167 family)
MSAELHIRVTPRSSQNKIKVQPDGSIRVWVTASPTDGQANGAVCNLVADALDLAKTRVTVLKGQTGRDKTLHIDGLDLGACKAKLQQAAK